METLLNIAGATVLIFIIGVTTDFILIKTGKVVNQDAYTLDDITILKHKGFIYTFSAYKHFRQVPEVQGIGTINFEANFLANNEPLTNA